MDHDIAEKGVAVTLADRPIKRPPQGWKESLRFLGPGLIVVGAVVGSGELVATTLLGAQVGFVVLWLIILSCMVKIIIQEQFAYYVITSGGTLIDAFNRLPGPHLRGLSCWSWLLFVFFVLALLPSGGIIGMSAMTVLLMFGRGNLAFWIFILAAIAVLIFWRGTYKRIEKAFIFMVASFSFSLMVALILTQGTDFAITWPELLSGLCFRLPQEGAYIAMSVFGITGIAAAEVIFYTYWCLEKGYGRYVGQPDGTQEWRERALGWISVLRKDVLLTASIYTGVTIAFYLLGAAILHRTQPNARNLEGMEVVIALSDIFTHSFGKWSFYVFMLGAFMVLYSTYISASASWPRFAADLFEHIGIISARTESSLNRWCNCFSIFLALFFVAIYFFIPMPVTLILFGGILSSLFLPLLGFSAVYLFRKRTHHDLIPELPAHLLLWVCTLVISAVVLMSLYLQFSGSARL